MREQQLYALEDRRIVVGERTSWKTAEIDSRCRSPIGWVSSFTNESRIKKRSARLKIGCDWL